LFQCLIQAEADNWRNRREVVDRKEDVSWFTSIHKIDENRLPCLGEIGGGGCDLKAALASQIFAFRQDFQVAGSDNAYHHVGNPCLERFRTARKFECQIFHIISGLIYQLRKRLGGWYRPSDQRTRS
jgi:hypothetical protein